MENTGKKNRQYDGTYIQIGGKKLRWRLQLEYIWQLIAKPGASVTL